METTPMSTKQLADALGLSLTYVCQIVNGRRTLARNPALRRQIAQALNVPQHWIERTPEAVPS
jgi:transcriptional regulator with XRE-family HTH domain